MLRKYLRKRRSHLVPDLLNLTHPRSWRPSAGTPPDKLSKVVYINLDSRADRRANIESELKKLSISPKRIAGVFLESMEDFRRRYPELESRPLAPFLHENLNGPLGYIGCYLSHLQAIRSCPGDNGFSLICEDDLAILGKNFNLWLQWAVTQPFDILLIDPQGNYKKSDATKRNIYQISEGSPTYWGAHAYLINNASRDRILRGLEKLPIDSPDHSLMELRHTLNVFAMRTTMCRPRGVLGTNMRRST